MKSLTNIEEILTSLLSFGNWSKGKTAFIYNLDNSIHIPFKQGFEGIEVRISNKEQQVIYEPSFEEKILLIQAFKLISNIDQEYCFKYLDKEKDISKYCPNNNPLQVKHLLKFKGGNKSIHKHKISTREKDFFEEELFLPDNTFSIGEKLGIIDIKNNLEYDKKFEEYDYKNRNIRRENNHKSIHKDKIVESLVLWDIENVNFYDDFSIISKNVKKENQLKFVSYFRKNKSHKDPFFWDINFKMNKLNKRDWIVLTTKDNADNQLIDIYHKYKYSLKELVLISGDSDFKKIIQDAIASGIKVSIFNNAKTEKSWFHKFDYFYINSESKKND